MKFVGNLFSRPPAPTALLVGMAILVVPGVSVQAGSDGVAIEAVGAVECISDDDCKIPYEYLASEATDPYLISGKPPTKRVDIRAAKRWPDVRSCLVRSERDAEQPDIAKVNWQRMRRPEDIEVCLFRVAASIGGPEGMEDWFQAQEMTGIETVLYQFVGQKRISTHAGNYIRQTNKTLVARNIFTRFFITRLANGETFTVEWIADGKLTTASYSLTTE